MRVRFGPFVLDTATRELREGGAPVHLSPKAFDLLQILIARRPALVSKAELQDELWPDTVVLEANLVNAVAEVRRALGDDPKTPAYVATVSRRGYRFCGEATDDGAAAAPPAVRRWLMWKDAVLPLGEGENVVGRHPESAVWIEASSVSRVHACIVVEPGRVTVEDRGSTNGTFVDGVRVSSRHVLVDGTTITFGSERAVYREWSDHSAPGTERIRVPDAASE